MRFCTTCGRNFDSSVVECPHDGTPLFEMHGGDDDTADELQSDGGAFVGEASDGVIEAPVVGATTEESDATDDEDAVVDAAESEDPVAEDGTDEGVDAGAAQTDDEEDFAAAVPNFAEVDEDDPFALDGAFDHSDDALELGGVDDDEFVSAEDELDDAPLFSDDEEIAGGEAPGEGAGELFAEDESDEAETDIYGDDASSDDSALNEDDADLGAELFDDEDDALDAVPGADTTPSSDRIAAGIQDALGDFDDEEGEKADEKPAAATPVDTAFSRDEKDEVAAAMPAEEKKGGIGKILLLLILIGVGVGWYFLMGPGAAPKKTDPAPQGAPASATAPAAADEQAADEEAASDETDKAAEEGEADPLAAGDEADAGETSSDAGEEAAADEEAEPEAADAPEKPAAEAPAKPSAERTPTATPRPKPNPEPKVQRDRVPPSPDPKKAESKKKDKAADSKPAGAPEKADGVETLLKKELDALKGN